jgi:DNA cross-link repair 1A protein
VVGLTEAATREQNPVSDESELLNDIKSDGGVEVVDLTEGGKKEHNLGAETKHDRGNREAELGGARTEPECSCSFDGGSLQA